MIGYKKARRIIDAPGLFMIVPAYSAANAG
jgi:hypothetical protein